MPRLKPGDKVMVYFDPITEQEPEGEAVLLQLLMKDLQSVPPLDYWRVRFTTDLFPVERFIKRRQADESGN